MVTFGNVQDRKSVFAGVYGARIIHPIFSVKKIEISGAT